MTEVKSIRTIVVPVNATGTTDAATGSATTEELHGFLLDVYLDYSASISGAATDVTIAYAAGTDGKFRGDQSTDVTVVARGNILVVTDNVTDGLHAPRQAAVGTTDGALTHYDYFPLDGPLTVSVAGTDQLSPAVTAYIRYLVG